MPSICVNANIARNLLIRSLTDKYMRSISYFMIIGVPKEIKDNEYRVSVTPSGAAALKEAGCRVLVETNAGAGSSFDDEEYRKAGAEISSAEDVWKAAELVIKVKEPRPEEYKYLSDGLIIFAFLHLAAEPALASALVKSSVTAIAYETIETDDRMTPILAPMSEVAGRLSVQIGANYLLKSNHGQGLLLSGVPGVPCGVVTILGAGMVGANAARIAVGLGAEVTVLDANIGRLRHLEGIFGARIKTLYSNSYNIEQAVKTADLLIGAAHVPGARTPKLVTREMVASMKKGSVIVDVSVDQGGCVETIKPTTHSNPVYEVSGVLHYGVANMPGAVPRTSTFALTNVTLPYLLKIATLGLKDAANSDPALKKGINVHQGMVTHRAVAIATNNDWRPLAIL